MNKGPVTIDMIGAFNSLSGMPKINTIYADTVVAVLLAKLEQANPEKFNELKALMRNEPDVIGQAVMQLNSQHNASAVTAGRMETQSASLTDTLSASGPKLNGGPSRDGNGLG